MEIECYLFAFPFEICIATAVIELNSNVDPKDGTKALPDLFVHRDDSRQNVCIQEKDSLADRFGKEPKTLLAKVGANFKKESSGGEHSLQQIIGMFDKANNYNVISPFPAVSYKKTEKGNCQEFSVSFYVVETGFDKVFSVLMPMILVSIVAFMNVLNDVRSNETAASHLQVSSVLTLAIVFVLKDACNRNKFMNVDNINTVFYFVGLVLASVPGTIAATDIPQIVGAAMMFLALVVPICHCFDYYLASKDITSMAKQATKNHQFLKGDNYKPDNDKDNYVRVIEYKDTNEDKEYNASEKSLSWIEGGRNREEIVPLPESTPGTLNSDPSGSLLPR